MEIVLASNSPRRKELLKYIVNDFKVHVSNVDETYDKNSTPEQISKFLSYKKAFAVSKLYPNDLVIGSDTIVSLDGLILEKPKDENDAYRMLSTLSSKTHQVITGVTIIYQGKVESFASITDVTFYELSDSEIHEYINTKEPFDKAGAYGIQGYASKFVKAIKGDFFTVVGLPVGELNQRLKKYLK